MSYELTIEPLGATIEVEEGQTLLDAALRQGIYIPHACGHGLCGTCKVQVSEGEVDHGHANPFALMDFERDAGKALVTLALRKTANGEELATEGEVQAAVVDLQGLRQSIAFKPVRAGDYTDYIGTFRVAERDSYRFEVTVTSAGRSGTVKFQRNF